MKSNIFNYLDEQSQKAVRTTAIVILSAATLLGVFLFVLNIIRMYFGWDFYSVAAVMVVGAASLVLMIKRKFMAAGSVFLFGMQLILLTEPFIIVNEPHGLAVYLIGNALGLLILMLFAGLFVGRLQLIISAVLTLAAITVVLYVSGDDELIMSAMYIQLALFIGAVFVFFINRLFITFITRAQEESRRKDVLLRELHHRVKNNLQIVSSMLNMQADKAAVPSDRQLFVDSENRISSIAIAHDYLYNAEDLELVLMDPYIRGLVSEVLGSADTAGLGIEVELDLEELTLDLQRAVLCGLIITELLMNSIQHAFPLSRSPGEKKISISLTLLPDGSNKLQVSDNGIGLTEALQNQTAKESGRGIGFYIVDALVDQMNARKSVSSSKGSRYEIIIPKK